VHTIVITMQSTIIQIGNSKGVRLPKDVLILSGIQKDIDIQVKKRTLIAWMTVKATEYSSKPFIVSHLSRFNLLQCF
jgi:hypothetical protein